MAFKAAEVTSRETRASGSAIDIRRSRTSPSRAREWSPIAKFLGMYALRTAAILVGTALGVPFAGLFAFFMFNATRIMLHVGETPVPLIDPDDPRPYGMRWWENHDMSVNDMDGYLIGGIFSGLALYFATQGVLALWRRSQSKQ